MNYIENLMAFIKESVSPFHAVSHAAERLASAGFTSLDFSEPWHLETGKGYFCRPFSGELFAFKTGRNFNPHEGAHIAAAHTDWPCLRIKPHASFTKNGYLQANVEIYGGPLLGTFFDRPLSIAGKLALKSSHPLKPDVMYINIKKPVLIVPNLAIHMNRGVNEEGLKIDKAAHLMPVLGIIEAQLNTENYLLRFIAEQAHIKPEDILDYELYAYNCDEPSFVGINDTLISAPRLDDMTSVSAAIDALIEAEPDQALSMTALFDNEETGSLTKQGADSSMIMLIMEKIWDAFGRTRIQCIEDLHCSMILSMDVAHGCHPNYPSANDISNLPVLGQGFCLKADSNQKYTWDCEALGALKQVCSAYDIPYQMCVKRTGSAGGGTIGPMLSAHLPVKTADIGVPLLSMHSARELMGARDQIYITEAVKAFLSL